MSATDRGNGEPVENRIVDAAIAKQPQSDNIGASSPPAEPPAPKSVDQGQASQTDDAADLNQKGGILAPPPPKFIQPNFERMPAELKQLRNWVIWAAIWNGSKYTKRPIQPSGYGASTTKPQHWSSFDDVKRAYERAVQRGYIEVHEKDKPSKHAVGGVGFVFDGQPDEDGLVYAGVDFDKITAGLEVASLAKERIVRLGSYVERSVSGNGLHVIVKARPLSSGVAHSGVELYTSGRFFTMTGGVIGKSRIIAAPDQFAALAEELRVQIAKNTSLPQAKIPFASSKEDTTSGGASAGGWFDQLPPNLKDEALDHALEVIATKTKYLELEQYGGNNDTYYRVMQGCARSGAPDAVDLWVKWASQARDADPEDKLREDFQRCMLTRATIGC